MGLCYSRPQQNLGIVLYSSDLTPALSSTQECTALQRPPQPSHRLTNIRYMFRVVCSAARQTVIARGFPNKLEAALGRSGMGREETRRKGATRCCRFVGLIFRVVLLFVVVCCCCCCVWAGQPMDPPKRQETTIGYDSVRDMASHGMVCHKTQRMQRDEKSQQE